jgi:hypothetical protein
MMCLPRGAAHIGPERRSDKLATIIAVVLFVFMGWSWFAVVGVFRPSAPKIPAFKATIPGYTGFYTAEMGNPRRFREKSSRTPTADCWA